LGGGKVDDAIELALNEYWLEAIQSTPPKVAPEWVQWKREELAAWIEGVIRGAALTVVPRLLEQYEVLEVEREDSTTLQTFGARWEQVPPSTMKAREIDELILQSRVDALLRDKVTNDILVLSIKTATDWTSRDAMAFRRDTQGLTEIMGVEARPEWLTKYGKVAGVQMLVCVKGKQYEDSNHEGKWLHYSPLLRAYREDSEVLGVTPEMDLSTGGGFAWTNNVPKTKRDGTQYVGKLGKEWQSCHTWEDYPGGMKRWVEALAGGLQAEGGDPWAKVFVVPEPWLRDGRSLEAIRRQIFHGELECHRGAEECRSWWSGSGHFDIYPKFVEALDRNFPQRKKHCYSYGGVCQFDPICHGGAEVEKGVLSGELEGVGFGLRVPHHSLEEGESDGD
jgi:hypothetical protein